jgi:hypothetical protein
MSEVGALTPTENAEEAAEHPIPGPSTTDSKPSHELASDRRATTDHRDVPTGRLEAIKLTGDINIPRGEYSFIAPDLGHGGFIRIADEELFRGARVVRSAGHIAHRGFVDDAYVPSQLIMVSHDTLAQFWQFEEGQGHISYYRRVDLDALLNFTGEGST